MLNWRAQLRTQQKLDELAEALRERPAPFVPVSQPASAYAPVREPGRAKLLPYVIDPPDDLYLTVLVKDAITGATARLYFDGQNSADEGHFRVRPNGTVSLGKWGSVNVAGLTADQAEAAIRKQLTKFPEKWPTEGLTGRPGSNRFTPSRCSVRRTVSSLTLPSVMPSSVQVSARSWSVQVLVFFPKLRGLW